MKKYIKDLQPGDKLFYLPGRAVAEPDDVVTEHTVVEIVRGDDGHNNYIGICVSDINDGKYPAFSYTEDELDVDAFCDKYGWYSTYKDGIKELYNKSIEEEIQFHKDSIERLTKEHLEQIEKLKKQFMS